MSGKITLERKPENPSTLKVIQEPHDNGANAMTARGVIIGVSESLAAGASLLIGYLLQEQLGLRLERPAFMAGAEVLLIATGLAFAYAFIFVLRRSYRNDPACSRRETASRLWINVSYAYLMELALLFLIKDSQFALGKGGLLLGYLTGIALLTVVAFITAVASKTQREGKRKLIIKTQGETVSAPARLSNRAVERPVGVEDRNEMREPSDTRSVTS